MKTHIILISVLFLAACTAKGPDGNSQYQAFAPDGIPFAVADSAWNVDGFGNHRAVVNVGQHKGNAVKTTLIWRRPDLKPDSKKIIVVEAASGKEIQNVAILDFSSERATLAFEAGETAGKYFIYYLPYKFRRNYGDARSGKPWNDYLQPEYTANPQWVATAKANQAALPEASVDRFESRSRFDFWTSMGLIATAAERERLKPADGFVLFPEDRAFPIRLLEVPARWAKTGASKHFEGFAQPNEYYCWQIGLWAANGAVNNVKLQFTDFKHSNTGATIPAKEITCFNTGGINWDGRPVTFTVDVPDGKVQALWCGLMIPENTIGRCYTGQVTVSADGAVPQTLDIAINVGKDVLADHGDSELWRHARMRWLNSTIGMNDLPVAPYEKMYFNGKAINATGRIVTLAGNGMPQSIKINDVEILDKPLDFTVAVAGKDITFKADNVKIQQKADGLVAWEASSEQDGLSFNATASMEYDGFLHFHILLSAEQSMAVNDIRLTAVYTPQASTYFIGTGFDGGFRPEHYEWDWRGPWDSYWTGDYRAGLRMEYRGGSYHGPLLNDYKPAPPAVWSNGGKGRIRLSGAPHQAATVVASTGANEINGKAVDFDFALLITPVKTLNPAKHFSERYFHGEPKMFDKAADDGANISNIHHATNLNPYINYPYVVRDSLIAHIKHQHAAGRKVKLYYTIREQSTWTTEVYALKSLNHEIFTGGVGQGLPWYCEHLIDDYKPAWYTELPGQQQDAALVLNAFSRWINYYLEGLRWMLVNYEIDGIYMDDVSFDREVMKRMRKIMAEYRPGALIDLHSNTGYSRGPINQYTDFFPYVDRLWFGESYRYNEMKPDEWFVAFSGIPFGEMSEMLQDGGNRYLGMVYGATARHWWTSNILSPVPVWQLWKRFGIEKATMSGYWESDCPVRTNLSNVKATAYIRNDSTLISIGNFDSREAMVSLSFDWKRLGIDPAKAILIAPEIENFQKARTFKIGEAIPVEGKKGWLIILKEKTL